MTNDADMDALIRAKVRRRSVTGCAPLTEAEAWFNRALANERENAPSTALGREVISRG